MSVPPGTWQALGAFQTSLHRAQQRESSKKGSIKGATDAINASNVLQFLFSQIQSQTAGTPQELRKSIKPFLINRLFIILPFSSAP